ncbi:hypothetical protein GP475_01650 [Corynebacterium poyangense]|uniref:Uncharacterized protein n=1 Tax=Corynebacterium poyangense TaxID=2684405 RepID=A0A7H0SLQ0_9CORY|nr:hypothetical protein [Corynebacterium poyangense]QNQ89475.1 hypothetical protein GP475_01650 [Corynebacterium poyangense]
MRLPTSLRLHWKPLAALIVFLVVLAVGFGGTMIRPIITSALSTKEDLNENILSSTPLFDSGIHNIAITYDETEYQNMVSEFQNSGEKTLSPRRSLLTEQL